MLVLGAQGGVMPALTILHMQGDLPALVQTSPQSHQQLWAVGGSPVGKDWKKKDVFKARKSFL
jgi:hypothetical protein